MQPVNIAGGKRTRQAANKSSQGQVLTNLAALENNRDETSGAVMVPQDQNLCLFGCGVQQVALTCLGRWFCSCTQCRLCPHPSKCCAGLRGWAKFLCSRDRGQVLGSSTLQASGLVGGIQKHLVVHLIPSFQDRFHLVI